eukprot:TRINITY_DN872_c0_g1_i1.p1 TRINITY_DN872_c0_g1~~TRINITY_DN872_c0_g1_i1.p1  ORF type:complete len:524 (-),score=140.69 TRINITY_DN872_c0_g1_i1:69-1640(-)
MSDPKRSAKSSAVWHRFRGKKDKDKTDNKHSKASTSAEVPSSAPTVVVTTNTNGSGIEVANGSGGGGSGGGSKIGSNVGSVVDNVVVHHAPPAAADRMSISPRSDLANAKALRAIALYDYVPEQDDEIGFDENEEIMVYEQDPSGWWTGQCRGNFGLFPGAFVRLVDADAQQQTTSTLTDSSVANDQQQLQPQQPQPIQNTEHQHTTTENTPQTYVQHHVPQHSQSMRYISGEGLYSIPEDQSTSGSNPSSRRSSQTMRHKSQEVHQPSRISGNYSNSSGSVPSRTSQEIKRLSRPGSQTLNQQQQLQQQPQLQQQQQQQHNTTKRASGQFSPNTTFRIAQMEEELRILRAKTSENDKEISRVHSLLSTAENARALAEGRARGLDDLMAESRAKYTKTQEELDRSKGQLQALRVQLEGQQVQLTQKEGQIIDLSAALERSRQQLLEAQSELDLEKKRKSLMISPTNSSSNSSSTSSSPRNSSPVVVVVDDTVRDALMSELLQAKADVTRMVLNMQDQLGMTKK